MRSKEGCPVLPRTIMSSSSALRAGGSALPSAAGAMALEG